MWYIFFKQESGFRLGEEARILTSPPPPPPLTSPILVFPFILYEVIKGPGAVKICKRSELYGDMQTERQTSDFPYYTYIQILLDWERRRMLNNGCRTVNNLWGLGTE
jgi:hypothetical protein